MVRTAEFHADAAGALGVWRMRWVCFPVVLAETQGCARVGSLALGYVMPPFQGFR